MTHYDFLVVGMHPGYPLKRSLLKFEDLPSTCREVISAEMHVHYWYGHKPSFMQVPWTPRPIQARQVLRGWNESEATARNRLYSTRWNQPYLSFGNDAKSSPDDFRTISNSTSSSYISWDITPTAKNWLMGAANHGILLSASNEDQVGRDIRFYGRKHGSCL